MTGNADGATATGANSTAVGANATASGDQSTSVGYGSTASAINSSAFGEASVATANSSVRSAQVPTSAYSVFGIRPGQHGQRLRQQAAPLAGVVASGPSDAARVGFGNHTSAA